MEKHHFLVLLGTVALLIGLGLFASADSWNRSWGEVSLQGGAIFLSVGLGAWSIVDSLRRKP